MATLALCCGKVCSGKSTFARGLEEGRGFFRFSADEWMLRLFGEEPDRRLFDEKLGRCVAMIHLLAERLLGKGIDVVLDFWFWTRASRQENLRRYSALGHRAVLVYFPVDPSLQAEYLRRRLAEGRADQYAFNEVALRALNSKFEEPEGEGELLPQAFLEGLGEAPPLPGR